MKSTELLINYAKKFGTFVVLLPPQRAFPCVVALGLRVNSQGRPRGIEADFIQFVATGREIFPSSAGEWPQGSKAADGLRYDGGRIIVQSGNDEYRLDVDRDCPVTLCSCSMPPDDFDRMSDPDVLDAYLEERPHTRAPLSLDMYVRQMHVDEERSPRPSSALRRNAPMYERPSMLKSAAWFLVGVALVFAGSIWLGVGTRRGVAVNFYGWAMVVMGATLIVRRGLDLLFPPSRL
jgi:hypothetical protein